MTTAWAWNSHLWLYNGDPVLPVVADLLGLFLLGAATRNASRNTERLGRLVLWTLTLFTAAFFVSFAGMTYGVEWTWHLPAEAQQGARLTTIAVVAGLAHLLIGWFLRSRKNPWLWLVLAESAWLAAFAWFFYGFTHWYVY
ncbi:hypothetical protein [Amycolatopsis taiwanensis]|nr:hypothetical protein [Amycolatopsis taiwanensis]